MIPDAEQRYRIAGVAACDAIAHLRYDALCVQRSKCKIHRRDAPRLGFAMRKSAQTKQSAT
jgi:hypothetical protein